MVNFLVIVADDLGYSDVGCFGGEIQTPNIDRIAKDGLRFTDFHAAAACSPTRSMLFSGTDHHLTGLGQLVEFIQNSPAHQGKPGHEGYLTDKVATLPEVLRENGNYYTLMSGKWHLGLKPEYAPCSRGFSKSFSLLPGCANHYGWEPQLEFEQIPKFMRTATAALHIEDDQYVDNDSLPSEFYSSDYYTDKLVSFLKERPKGKPFFAYMPYSAPHWPLQAPEENVQKYKGYYEDGPSALKQKRMQGLIDKGLVDPSVVPHPFVNTGTPEWDAMTPEQQAKSARSMEVYAGMVDRMDYNIGKIIQTLKEQGIYDDTVIVFMSDNGAEGASYEALPVIGEEVMKHIEQYYDNSLENIGRKNSFVWYGSMWAQAATSPARLFKMYPTEGGCRVPFILKGASDLLPIEKGSICTEFCTVMDIMPTFLDLAQVPKPGPEFRGRQVLSMRGASWVPFFTQKQKRIHAEDHVTGWELVGQAALRKGDWKIVFVAQPVGPEVWQLYDLSKDPGETNDLAKEYPEKVKELVKHWEDYAQETGVVGLKPELGTVVVKDEMEDPRKWMKYESSSSIITELRKQKVASN
uniref:ARAD1C00374p n=1 Tax=Blastobotrys adeninivorans TaxID=409370 RepID=A0A060SYD9_BLAAD